MMKLILTPLCFTEGCKGSSTDSPALPILPKAHTHLSCDSAPGRGGFRKSLGLTSSFAINPKRPGKTCNATLALVILQKQALTRPWLEGQGSSCLEHCPGRSSPALAAFSSSKDPGAPAIPDTLPGQAQQGGRAAQGAAAHLGLHPCILQADLSPILSRAGRWAHTHICPGKSGQLAEGKNCFLKERSSESVQGCCCWSVNVSDRQQAVPAKAAAPGIPHPTN